MKLIYEAIRVIAASILSVFFNRRGPLPPPQGAIRRILVVRNDFLGDMVMFLPALKGIREGFPDAHLELWTSDISREVVEGSGWVDDFIIFNLFRIEKASLKELFDLVLLLRRKRFDLVVTTDLAVGITQLVAFLAGAPYRLGYSGTHRPYLFNIIVPSAPEGHRTDESLKILKALGLPPAHQVLKTDLWPRKEDRDRVASFLEKAGVKDRDLFIGMNLATKQPSKIWQAENWVTVAKTLRARHNFRIILFGGADARSFADAVLESIGRDVIDSVGKMNVKELALLIGRCAILLSVDSGPAHIGVVLGVPTVVLFGKANPLQWGYPLVNTFRAVSVAVPCRPCGKIECRDVLCMKGITPDMVVAKAEELLANTQHTDRTL